jgi:hypothetical protein
MMNAFKPNWQVFKNLIFKEIDINENLACVLIFQFLVRLTIISLLPYGALSVDAYSWLKVAILLKLGINPYTASPFLNWPPLWMQIIYAFSKISMLLHISFLYLIKFFLIFSELILTMALYLGLKVIYNKKHGMLLIWATVLNPIVILLNIQHLNFDVLVALWETCFLISLFYYVDNKKAVDWLYACLFLGLGILTKGVPLILLPLIFVEFQRLDIKEKILGFILIFSPTILGLSILYCLNPSGIIENVLKYKGALGCFGISGIMINFLNIPFSSCQKFLTCLIVFFPLILSCLVNLKQHLSKYQILIVGIILISFHIIFAPGYGIQYIYWIIPFIILIFPYLTATGKKYIKFIYLIAACTFFIEYALLPPYGAFLFNVLHSFFGVEQISWSYQEVTLLNLPLFFIYCSILFFSSKLFIKSLKQEKQIS